MWTVGACSYYMHSIRLRSVSILTLSLTMIVLGALGLTGVVTPGPILVAVLLGIALILSYDAI